jgi:hypothetical protein
MINLRFTLKYNCNETDMILQALADQQKPPSLCRAAGSDKQMEDRHIIAYTLCAAMVIFLSVFLARYLHNRRQFKLRQSGRGKSSDSVPAE